MHLQSLTTWGFRNLAPTTVEFSDGVVAVIGRNGQGKTNLLEAVATLGTVRSFRGASPRKMVRHGEGGFRLEGEVVGREGCSRLRQVVEVGPPSHRTIELDGVPCPLERYLRVLPVFALTGADDQLVVGPPENRRTYLDRTAFLIRASHLESIRAYRRLLSQRNAGLNAGRADAELAVWEDALAEASARVVAGRREAVGIVAPAFEAAYERLRADDFPHLFMTYRGDADGGDDPTELAKFYRKRYHSSRDRDRQAGFTTDGPHRHDLGLRADKRNVRDVLSAGQVKVVAASLNIAALIEVERRLGEVVPVLVDDADAEIDRGILERLLTALGGERQVLCSSAHGDTVLEVARPASVIEMRAGVAEPR